MKLSPTMQALVDYMRKHDSEIHRHPGGYWAHKTWHLHAGASFGTTSVEALVSRKVAEYSEWQVSRRGGGRFPVKATLTLQPSDSNGRQP